jgi:hypothetical protein
MNLNTEVAMQSTTENRTEGKENTPRHRSGGSAEKGAEEIGIIYKIVCPNMK